jgi:hypothetical protein
MIHIEKNQNIPENENLRIFTETGDYEDTALIEFYDISNSDIAVGSFQAQYVKYGSLVYRYNDNLELGREILKIEPESTHSAASYVRMTDELLLKMNSGSLELDSLDKVLTTEKEKNEAIIEEAGTKEDFYEEELPSSEEAVVVPLDSTPSPEVVGETPIGEILGTETSSTNEEVLEIKDEPNPELTPTTDLSGEKSVSTLSRKNKRGTV